MEFVESSNTFKYLQPSGSYWIISYFNWLHFFCVFLMLIHFLCILHWLSAIDSLWNRCPDRHTDRFKYEWLEDRPTMLGSVLERPTETSIYFMLVFTCISPALEPRVIRYRIRCNRVTIRGPRTDCLTSIFIWVSVNFNHRITEDQRQTE